MRSASAVQEDNAVTKRKPAVVEYRNPGVALPVAEALSPSGDD